MARRTRGIGEVSRRWASRLFTRNGSPEGNGSAVAVQKGVPGNGMPVGIDLERQAALPDINDARGGETDAGSATDRQLRYIRTLGGDPHDVSSKKEASDLIKRLQLRKMFLPLDPDALADRGTRAGVDTQGEWRSAHDGLLGRLRLDLQTYVNLCLSSLRAKLSDPLGPGGSGQSHGPSDLVRRAEEEVKQLALCSKYGKPLDVVVMAHESDGSAVQGSEAEEKAAPVRAPVANEKPTKDWVRWLGLISISALLVVVESAVNIGLLMGALPGGALEAFMMAALVSTINVGGFGVCAGLLLSWLQRSSKWGSSWLYRIRWWVWITCALAFNLIAGRHREAYAHVLESISNAPTAPIPAVRDVLPGVPFNPLAWEFQALLFCLLGLFLCALGFTKGFTFRKEKAKGSPVHGQRSADQADSGDGESPGADAGPPGVFKAFASLPTRYAGILKNRLRRDVAHWYRALDRERRDVVTLLDTLNEMQFRQACVDTVEHAFVAAHNNAYPDKIDLETVQAHRREKHGEPLALTIPDPRALEEAAALVARWKESGHTEFDDRIATAQTEIAAITKKYEPMVLGKPAVVSSR